MIKPDGVQRGLIGKIVSRFETRGFKLVGMKLAQPDKAQFEKHYSDLSNKPFFQGLINYAASGPVCCMVWEGDNAVKTVRKMLGATQPFDSEPDIIRGGSFFQGLIDYVAPVNDLFRIREVNLLIDGRKMLDASQPFDSEPGTIRGDFRFDVRRNVIHGSDSVKSAKKEIALWF